MLIRSPNLLNVYRPASLVDYVDKNGNLTCVQHLTTYESNMYFWCWMEKNVGRNIFSSTNSIQRYPAWFFFSSFMKCWMKSVRLNRSNIFSNISNFACWMKCCTRLSWSFKANLNGSKIYMQHFLVMLHGIRLNIGWKF